VAQPGRDHPRVVARLRERAAALGPLRLAGAYLEGVSVADALASGARAGWELRKGADPSLNEPPA
jgi:hypothetical protein